MILATFALVSLLLCASATIAQQIIPLSESCWYPEGGTECLPAPPLWIDDGTEGAFSLDHLARLGGPILWFSPREFLLLERRTSDAPGSILQPGAGRTVYYRIREVRLRGGSPQPKLPDDMQIADPDATWQSRDPARPIESLDRIFIQYFLYYPEDRGIGGHAHDLEALELQVEMRRVCIGTASKESGRTKATKQVSECWSGATIRSVSGSAHGVGWYTNTLRVDATRDTVLPLTILVEENKHASVPDRDGDGRYMPHYDVNRQVNDAWGIRDVAGSGWLGGPTFRAELVRERNDQDQVCPPNISDRLRTYYRFHRREVNGTGCVGGGNQRTYTVTRAGDERLCAAGKPKTDEDKLYDLMNDKQFCRPARDTRIVKPRTPFGVGLRRVLTEISPGPNGEFGFQNAVQRLSFAYRYDGGHGVSSILPLGRELPVIGGWAVVKLNAIFDTLDSALPPVERGSVEVLYAPSASRAIDWYTSVGAEGYRSAANAARVWAPVGEMGVRIRFSAERVRLVRFFGGRLGVRADLKSPIRNARLIYEFGAGSW
ncbi:hypothetical protein TBR22_A05690 [Luteitalea sp. TBR-22]|uniref:hypothetical protein n=1 Tax=Luteitalea sp. TBR-22 TaxID=2802971 RepID=UPI001AF3796E|nr:hypothetical protein [Luteitalea sp. TBR-22]BCS31369.1 hypothetical protein TBR22_A05690 [Luteitalea sp. TBR-22]